MLRLPALYDSINSSNFVRKSARARWVRTNASSCARTSTKNCRVRYTPDLYSRKPTPPCSSTRLRDSRRRRRGYYVMATRTHCVHMVELPACGPIEFVMSQRSSEMPDLSSAADQGGT